MSNRPDEQQPQSIDEVSAELRRGLRLCHSVVDDFRLKLAANSNDASPANDDEDESRIG